MPPVIIHYHIFKNAGTTLIDSLSRNFGNLAIDYDGRNPPDERISPAELQRIIEAYGNKIRSFTSHRLRLPHPTSTLFRPLPVILLRHPIDRAVSAYHFWRRWIDAPYQVAKKAQKQGIKEFFEDFDRSGWLIAYKNEQTRFASRLDLQEKITEEDFIKAKENLRLCLFVGETDRYDASMVVLEEKLKPYFPKINLAYIRRNITQGRGDTLNKRLEYARSELGSNIYDKMIKQNEFDLPLIRMVRRSLDNQMDKVPNFEEKLNDFRRRCRQLQKGETAGIKVLKDL